MYAHCLWCQQSLGRNEVLEAFPVGRRLAFDAAKGRLWVVCGKCERWNLTPLEERWEAIEACERFYRDTRTRASTGQIGLAKLREGLELVRIGQPLLPEFAAWRYGDQFLQRRKRHLAVEIAYHGTELALMVVSGFAVFGSGIGTFVRNIVDSTRRVGTIPLPAGGASALTPMMADRARYDRRDGTEILVVPQKPRARRVTADTVDVIGALERGGRRKDAFFDWDARPEDWITYRGDDVAPMLARLLPHVNRAGETKKVVAQSVGLVQERRDLAALWSARQMPSVRTALAGVDAAARLAMEIHLHEADERRWLEGELAELETRWREAEALAAIADRLTVPAEVDARLDAVRKAAS